MFGEHVHVLKKTVVPFCNQQGHMLHAKPDLRVKVKEDSLTAFGFIWWLALESPGIEEVDGFPR